MVTSLLGSGTGLTPGYGEELEAAMAATFPGMAFWAGTGPAHRMCKDCRYWQAPKASGEKRDEAGRLRPKRCDLYPKMAHGDIVREGVPAAAPSCRHFEVGRELAMVKERRNGKRKVDDGNGGGDRGGREALDAA